MKILFLFAVAVTCLLLPTEGRGRQQQWTNENYNKPGSQVANHPKMKQRSWAGNVGILGVPVEEGQPKKGVKAGPAAIRNFGVGIVKELEDLGLNVMDFGDVMYDVAGDDPKCTVKNVKNMCDIAEAQKQTSKKVTEIMRKGYRALSLGGDHTMSIGTVDGHIKVARNVSLLWVDAHGDINTAGTSSTGNVHGMPVALLVKELARYWPALPNMEWRIPRLSTSNVAYIANRDIDPYERVIFNKFNIRAFAMGEIEEYGIIQVVKMALRSIDPYKNRSLHVSFDIDALDPLEAASTGTPVRGGMTMREGIQIMEELHRTGRLNAVDIAEVNPSIGNERDVNMTVQAAQYLIKAAFGMDRHGQYRPDLVDIPLPEKSTTNDTFE